MPNLLSDIEDWVIDECYQISDEDQEILNNTPITEAKQWKNKIYKPLKDRFRNYYYEKQNGRCAYCRLLINRGTGNVEIEHIIDKNRRLDFVFESKNLVVSCHNCNFSKKTSKVMHNCPPENDYPTNSDNFKIIHGHYDKYSHHIKFIEKSIYQAITDEGEFTIDKCSLDRIGLAEQRETVNMYENDPLIADVIGIRNSDKKNDKIDELINKLKALKDDN